MEEKKLTETEESFVRKMFGCCFNGNEGESELENEGTSRDLILRSRSKLIFENEF